MYCDSKGLLSESRYKVCIVTEAAGLAGCAGHWAALAWGAGQVLGARLGVQGVRGRRQALGRRRTGAQADAGQALRRAAGA